MKRKKEIEQAAKNYWDESKYKSDLSGFPIEAFKAGVEWADATAWKPADGNNLPEIDREVIALAEEQGYYKVVFAHRPNPNGDAICFGKGGWNQPNVKWWLELELPIMEQHLCYECRFLGCSPLGHYICNKHEDDKHHLCSPYQGSCEYFKNKENKL